MKLRHFHPKSGAVLIANSAVLILKVRGIIRLKIQEIAIFKVFSAKYPQNLCFQLVFFYIC